MYYVGIKLLGQLKSLVNEGQVSFVVCALEDMTLRESYFLQIMMVPLRRILE